MTVDDETEEVFAGDSIPNRLGGSHGLYNPPQSEIELIVKAVSMEKGKSDRQDHGDDLVSR